MTAARPSDIKERFDKLFRGPSGKARADDFPFG
jgi:hypothetical protein